MDFVYTLIDLGIGFLFLEPQKAAAVAKAKVIGRSQPEIPPLQSGSVDFDFFQQRFDSSQDTIDPDLRKAFFSNHKSFDRHKENRRRKSREFYQWRRCKCCPSTLQGRCDAFCQILHKKKIEREQQLKVQEWRTSRALAVRRLRRRLSF
jgi:hypothetical protein